ncbi:TetR/AcrR family transcriptional regulator C-terminal domain-containing protein [Nonomuraea endophytica]|uniref:AcrR family transcriptional regulator n=1 Tax=Nonomuraea endophytica TaxID=714136 RepID=A0A7W8EIK7_9ACTN|nr:TetR/AcrR family transcriptional regulator C-terminal domain-containing protein [Nonomuraea endophytica]MBB5080663.1 AcrR family transcriptional regulator [Nonomuraea endophytica]
MTKQFTSVWTREPRSPRSSPGLSREQIVHAALELLDSEGTEGLSMRKLGAKLDAGATSIYWYVANKDELMELAYDEIWADMEVADPDQISWRYSAATFGKGMRQAILRHPWAARLIGRLPAIGPNALHATDLLRKAFTQAGFRGLEIDYAASTLTAYVFGMTIPEAVWNEYINERQPDMDGMRQAVVAAVAGYPEMQARVEEMHAHDPQEIRAMSFDFGLYTVLDGLEARLVT